MLVTEKELGLCDHTGREICVSGTYLTSGHHPGLPQFHVLGRSMDSTAYALIFRPTFLSKLVCSSSWSRLGRLAVSGHTGNFAPHTINVSTLYSGLKTSHNRVHEVATVHRGVRHLVFGLPLTLLSSSDHLCGYQRIARSATSMLWKIHTWMDKVLPVIKDRRVSEIPGRSTSLFVTIDKSLPERL